MPYLPSDSGSDSRWNLSRLGMVSALVYLIAFTLPYWLPSYYLKVQDEIYQFAAREPWRGVLFYVALVVLFALFVAGHRLVLRDEQQGVSAWSIGSWAAVFCALLIPVKSFTSSDVYSYVFQGRIVAVLGANPFAHLYNEFAADPFYYCVTFRNLPATTGYGPLWIAIEAMLGWLARDRLLLNLLLFKGLAAGLHVTSAFLVYGTLKRLAPKMCMVGMLFYAWNPLLLLELVGNAHNDATVAFFALLGFYLLSRDRGLASIPSLTAAVLIKPVVLLWLPLVAAWILARCGDWPGRLCQAMLIAVLVTLTAVIAYAPFWAGADTFRGVLAQSDIHGNSLPSLLIHMLWSVWPDSTDWIVQGTKLLTAGAFVPFYLNRLWASRREPVRASYDVMLFYLLFVSFQFMPWYVVWLVVPAALLADRFRQRLAMALSLLAPLLYFPFGWQRAKTSWPVIGTAFAAALPALGLCLWLGVRAWQVLRSK